MIKIISVVVVTLLIIGGSIFVFTKMDNQSNSQEKPVQMSESDNPVETKDSAQETTINTAGQFISYEDYQANMQDFADKDVVLFFSAKWCPTCQALNKDINANLNNIPSNVVIVSVDYDSNIDLRRQYGVTVQHTLVMVDNDGNQIKKWTGGNTLDSVLGQI